MPLNPSKGNMFPWITHTWNTVKGACPHSCSYCYCKRWGPQKPARLDKKELKTDLGSGNFIFVGSSCDLFAAGISLPWIGDTLNHCMIYEKYNRFLFQSKNPGAFTSWMFPFKTIFGTTIETNRTYPEMGKAPPPDIRALGLQRVGPRIVTIEPIMDFDLDDLIFLVHTCEPKWVNIGANTAHWIDLPEPEPAKVRELIAALQEFTEVKIKDNLKRLLR